MISLRLLNKLSKVDAYFARFHFLMPIIDKPSFLRQYNTVMNNTQDLHLVRAETAFISLVFAVFACAANLVQDPRLSTSERLDDGGMGMVYYERCVLPYGDPFFSEVLTLDNAVP